MPWDRSQQKLKDGTKGQSSAEQRILDQKTKYSDKNSKESGRVLEEDRTSKATDHLGAGDELPGLGQVGVQGLRAPGDPLRLVRLAKGS